MKCKILCPVLLIDGTVASGKCESEECCVNEFANAILSFDSDADVAEIYMRLKRGEAVVMEKFGILPCEAEQPSVLQSEFPLTLKRTTEKQWQLSPRITNQ